MSTHFRTGEEMHLSTTASTELKALAEVLTVAAPGLKMPPLTLASTVQRMLLTRGVALTPVSETNPSV